NQFNLTTRRCDATTLQALMDDPDAHVLWLDLKDRFGANGIVGCAILRFQGEDAVIDSLMLSCRVIGRGAEAVLVNKIAAIARGRGARTLIGEFIPSERNAQVADLYSRLGFVPAGDVGSARRWTWALLEGEPPVPGWIEVVDRDGEGQ
ncbi:MAG TPA: GNAT family N-acetyltransferase, partial [Actinomycetota bacterium]|nr:GNAT family N-acetyltransferase [Actinomycetota bacterium]